MGLSRGGKPLARRTSPRLIRSTVIRNVSDFPGRSFFFCYSTLVSELVEADVSDLVAFALSSGSIIGLNKDDEELKRYA